MEAEEQDREYLENEDLTPFDVVDLIRSNDGDDKAKALDWLFPDQAVALVVHYPKTAQSGIAVTKTPHVAGLFTALCWSAQHVGNALGMKLDWVKKRPDDQKILIPRGGLPK